MNIPSVVCEHIWQFMTGDVGLGKPTFKSKFWKISCTDQSRSSTNAIVALPTRLHSRLENALDYPLQETQRLCCAAQTIRIIWNRTTPAWSRVSCTSAMGPSASASYDGAVQVDFAAKFIQPILVPICFRRLYIYSSHPLRTIIS